MNRQENKDGKEISPLYAAGDASRTIMDSLSAHIAIIDDKGVILDTNEAWRKYALENGMPEGYDAIGDNYLDICDAAKGEDAADANAVAAGIRKVINGSLKEFLLDYPCHSLPPLWLQKIV